MGESATLDQTVEMVHEMWTEWMENPPLEIDSFEEQDLNLIIGRWSGSGIAEETEKLRICIEFNENGTWAASKPWPDLKNAYWYIHNNMILLFDGPLSPNESPPTFITAVVFKSGTPYLIAADDDSGLIELRRTEQSGVDNPDQRARIFDRP